MNRARKKDNGSGKTGANRVVMRLFIAGNAPNSVQAIANLKVWVLVTLGTALTGVIGAAAALLAATGHRP